MSRKKSKSTYAAVLEGLAPSDAEELQASTYAANPDAEMVEKTLSYITEKSACIAAACEKYSRTNMPADMLKIVQELELARYAARKLADYAAMPEADVQTVEEEQLKDIRVSGPAGIVLLKLELVPLVAHPFKGAYNAYYSVKKAVQAYAKKQPNHLDPRARYTLVYQRVVAGKVQLSAGCCDNDNFEMQRVTNAITEAIGIADSADKFSFYYTTVTGEEARTFAYLVLEKDFAALLNDNGFKNPKVTRIG